MVAQGGSTRSLSRGDRRGQEGFMQRLGHRVRQSTTTRGILKRPSSMEHSNGPVCVDDFVVESSPAIVKRTSYFSSKVVDLDDAVPDGHRFSVNDSSLETSSSSSTDDSYQADLRGSERKRVSFSDVSLRVYAATISDSPCASSTYPIGLDWKHSEAVTIELEEFEEKKSNTVDGTAILLRGFRRPKRLTPHDRFQRISELSGLSHGEIYELEHARSSRRCRMPPEGSVTGLPSSTKHTQKSNRSFQIIDMDSGYQCVDV